MTYKVIADKEQYFEYCKMLENLMFSGLGEPAIKDEVDMLTLLIEKWDADHNTFDDLDPISLIRSLMADHNLNSKDLGGILGLSKGYVSEILNYKKGISKEGIRRLVEHFKVSQEAFNRPYQLPAAITAPHKSARALAKKTKAVAHKSKQTSVPSHKFMKMINFY